MKSSPFLTFTLRQIKKKPPLAVIARINAIRRNGTTRESKLKLTVSSFLCCCFTARQTVCGRSCLSFIEKSMWATVVPCLVSVVNWLCFAQCMCLLCSRDILSFAKIVVKKNGRYQLYVHVRDLNARWSFVSTTRIGISQKVSSNELHLDKGRSSRNKCHSLMWVSKPSSACLLAKKKKEHKGESENNVQYESILRTTFFLCYPYVFFNDSPHHLPTKSWDTCVWTIRDPPFATKNTGAYQIKSTPEFLLLLVTFRCVFLHTLGHCLLPGPPLFSSPTSEVRDLMLFLVHNHTLVQSLPKIRNPLEPFVYNWTHLRILV